MAQIQSLRPLMSGPMLAGAGVSLALAGASGPVLAQQAATTATTTESGVTELDTVVVTGAQDGPNTNAAGTGIGRLPGSVRETPKVVTVVPAEVIRQQGATTLEETLRNVPGITLSTGEGRGGSNGDQFRIRGLMAQGDLYLDGLRDFGVYSHDSFNTEAVQVVKGPSGDAFGVGNIGGLVNQSTKRATLENFTEATASLGSGPEMRAQVDTNRVLGDGQALRFNAMVQKKDVADRDNVTADARGIALDWGIGIGTGTEWHLSYSYLQNRGRPDMGQPMAMGRDGIIRPLLEAGVPGYNRSTSYVRSTDRDDTDTHVLSSALTHDMDNGLTLSNDTRLTRYKRNFSASNPGPCNEACLAGLRAGVDQPLRYGAGGGMSYLQEGWGFQNILSVKGEFHTGGLRHQIQAGLDLNYQIDKRHRGSWTVPRLANSTILNPIFDAGPAVLAFSDDANVAKSFNAGLFLSDRVHFNNQWSVLASARADYFDSSFDGVMIATTNRVQGASRASVVSPSLSVIYEPTENTMAYLTFARTYRPLGTDIASAAQSFASEIPASDAKFKPERSDLIELGGKMDVMDGRVGLTAAIYQITKRNSYDRDPTTGEITAGFLDAGSSRRIRGLELGISGEVAENWTLQGAYSYTQGKILDGPGVAPEIVGNDAPGVSKHSVALWSAYTMPAGKGDLTIGGGVRYASKYWTNTANDAEIPNTLSVDAMIAYDVDDWRVQFNANNLTDHQNYASAFSSSRVVPAAGRNVSLTVSKRF